MSNAPLLAQLHRLIEAPQAIPQLRNLLLDLAVRGVLSDQDERDEPASVLLEHIDLAMKSAGLRRRRLPPLEARDQPFELPEGWEWVRIRQVTADRGQTVPDAAFTYIDVGAIDQEAGRIRAPTVLTPDTAPTRARKLVADGDVLYSCVRPYLLNVAVVDGAIAPRPIASTAFAVLNGFGLVSPRYIWTALRSPFMTDQVTEKMRGQAYPAINDSDFAALPFPLPPLGEQLRIVARVDELMTLCDQVEAARTERHRRRDVLRAQSCKQLALAARSGDAETFGDVARDYLTNAGRWLVDASAVSAFRATVIALGMWGKLAPQDPSDEPAEVVLRRVASEKLAVGLAVTGREWVGDIDHASESPALPTGWSWTWVGRAVERVTVGYVGPMVSHYADSGVPFVRSQNVRANRFRSDGLIFIKRAFHAQIAKSALAPGDVIVVRSGNVGTACVIPDELPEANCSDVVIVKRPLAVLPDYLSFYLNSAASEYVRTGSVGMALTHFNTKSVARLPLALPPLPEQNRIVAAIHELMALCDQLERSVASVQTKRSRLMAATVHDALLALPSRRL